MAAPTLDESKPTFGANAVDAAMTQLRSNITWLVAIGAINAMSIPPWNAVPSGANLDKPDYVELTHAVDSRKVKATFTYTGDNVTTIVLAFNSGAGYANFAYGTATIAYNGSGQWTGTTWS
jgi:hypothetical protein